MNKKALLLVASAALLVGCNNGSNENDQPEEPEKVYKIKKIEEVYKNSRASEWSPRNREDYSYDNKWNLIEHKITTYEVEPETVSEIYTYEYNEEGYETKYCDISYDAPTRTIRSKYEVIYSNYDEFGNCCYEKSQIYYDDPFETPTSITVITREFDETGKKIKEIENSPYKNEKITYDYYSNGLLKTKYFADIDGEDKIPTHKIEYTYYENTDLQKDIEVFYYFETSYEQSASYKDHFEYNEEGFMTLYAIYESGELSGSTQIEITSDVSYKMTLSGKTPDFDMAIIESEEVTYLTHEDMLENNYSAIVSSETLSFDAYYSTTLPNNRTKIAYTYENGLVTESLYEVISYQAGTETEISYYAYNSSYEYYEI